MHQPEVRIRLACRKNCQWVLSAGTDCGATGIGVFLIGHKCRSTRFGACSHSCLDRTPSLRPTHRDHSSLSIFGVDPLQKVPWHPRSASELSSLAWPISLVDRVCIQLKLLFNVDKCGMYA